MSNVEQESESYNNTDIFKFLEQYRVTDNKYTHLSMGKPLGKFSIPDSRMEDFYNLYNLAINEDKTLSLIEKHNNISPIVVDLDFKFSAADITNRLLTEEHIVNILKLYITEIKKYFSVDNEQLISCVFLRSAPYIKDVVLKDGIHIIFPRIVSTPQIQFMIRNEVLKRIDSVLGDLPVINEYSDIIDELVISRNGWIMYGSCKPGLDAYQLDYCYDHNVELISLDDFEGNDLEDYTRLFSIRNKMIPSPIKSEYRSLAIVPSVKRNQKIIQKHKLTESEVIDIDNMVSLLSPVRAETESQWIELGWCLHNIDSSCEQLLNIWVDFSRKSSKYKSGECENRWNNFNNRSDGFTIATLYYWARNDNPNEYNKIQRSNLEYHINRAMSGTHYDVACVLHHMFKNIYVCTSFKDKEWYIFENHKWQKTNAGVSIRAKISTDLNNEYCHLIGEYNKRSTLANVDVTDEQREEYKAKCKTIHNVTLKLRDTTFKNNVMKECAEIFYDAKFLDKMDTRLYLLCFENGVYDLKKDMFRDGRPEDYLTISTGVNYIPYDIDSELVHQVDTFMSQVFVIPDIRRYVWELMSSYLQGHNADELFHLWIGTGSNSKSKLIELFESAFGNYCIKFPITLLTQKRAASNSATPEVAGSKGKRFGSFQEPGQNEKLNIGLMKELTGGDKIKARALYSNPIEFKPQFKLLLVCNHFPEVPGDDDATWRRIRVVEFQSKFVNNPDPENPLEFTRDSYLSDKMKDWPETFISMLIEHYKNYKKYGLREPAEILKYTNEYQKRCDSISEFIEEYAYKSDNSDDIITLNNIYEDYREWFIDMYSNLKQPSKSEFITYMKKKYSKIIKKGRKKNEFYLFGYIKTDNYIAQDNDDDE
jgi:P4 family phage/plasmid primase-like protien